MKNLKKWEGGREKGREGKREQPIRDYLTFAFFAFQVGAPVDVWGHFLRPGRAAYRRYENAKQQHRQERTHHRRKRTDDISKTPPLSHPMLGRVRDVLRVSVLEQPWHYQVRLQWMEAMTTEALTGTHTFKK